MAKAKKSTTSPEDSEEKDALAQLFAIEQKIRELESVGNPGHYGLPDLLFPKGYKQGFYDISGDKARNDPKYVAFNDGWCREKMENIESDEAYQIRQDKALEKFVTESMFIMKDGKQVYVKIIAEMLNWLGSIFFSRETLTITWKPRGGGGSLTAAVLIFLLIIYHKKSILDLAGSAEQSKIVYEYVKSFWDIIPGLKEGLVSGDPLAQVTRLKTGQELKCSPSTQKQARGKHFSVIFVDELCQEDPRVEAAMRAAIQGALSEPEPIICLFSTFHIPVGLFQEYWDNYEERGFARFNWNILDTMQPCIRGMETATPEDPKALTYCKGCFLTEKKSVKDAAGKDISEVWTGCNGYARDSKGWATFESVCKAKTLNLGTGVFETEFLCARPGFTASVYSPELIDDALTDPLLIDPRIDKITVGIDWGIQTADSLAINFTVRKPEFVYIMDIIYADHTLVSDVVTILNQWRTKFGEFTIIADASHQFNNGDLAAAGFDIRPASFGTWKKFGIENITKHLVFHRIKINKTLTKLIDQLKHYRKNPTTGAIVKKNDHGPDSLNFAMLNYKFEEEFGPDIDKAVVVHEQKTMLGVKDIKISGATPVFEGVAVPKVCGIQEVPGVVLPRKDKNVMVF